MNRRRDILIVCCIVAVGLAVRLATSWDRTLWQDEAETTINSLQIIDHGYPSDTFKGKPLYESKSYIRSNDQKYQYASTNYHGSHYERNKGWLTYYYQALFLKMFGFSTFVARLPFLLLYIVTSSLLFVIGRRFFGRTAGMLAAGLYAIDYAAVWYDAQARYYSVLTVLALALVYATFRAVTEGSRRWYVLSGIILALLFYTHMVTFAAAACFVVCVHLFHSRRIGSVFRSKPLVMFLSVAGVCIPWFIAVRFWEVTGMLSDMTDVYVWFIGLAGFLIAAGTLVLMLSPLYRLRPSWKLTPVACLLLYFAATAVVKPILIPAESFATRTFVELHTMYCLLAGYLAALALAHPRTTRAMELTVPTMLLTLVVVVFTAILEPVGKVPRDPSWVRPSIAYLDRLHLAPDTPVLVSYQQFPFMLYSDYNVDLVWPLRKSYIDSYPGRMIIILDDRMLEYTSFYPKNEFPKNGPNYGDRIAGCAPTALTTTVTAYDCPTL